MSDFEKAEKEAKEFGRDALLALCIGVFVGWGIGEVIELASKFFDRIG